MKNLTKPTLLICFIVLCFSSYSQVGVTSYSIYALGVNTSQNKTISGEIKLFANRKIDEVFTEVDVFYNFKQGTYHRFSLGVGFSFVPFKSFDKADAFTVPAQLEIYPLQDFKKLSLLFELTPEFVIEGDVNIRSLWGIRYTFGALKD